MQKLLAHLRSIEAGHDTNERFLQRLAPSSSGVPTKEDDIYKLLRKSRTKKPPAKKPPRQQRPAQPQPKPDSLHDRRERLHTVMSYELNRKANLSVVPLPAPMASPPKVRHLDPKLQRALTSARDHQADEVRAAEIDVDTALHDAETLLPLSFLMERNLAALCQSKAGAIIKTAFETFALHFYDDAWHHWMAFVASARERERDAAVRVLSRVYRGHLARRACVQLRATYAALNAATAAVLDQRIAHRRSSALRIQMAFRQYGVRRRHAEAIAKHTAARVIQHLVLYQKARALRFAAMLADVRRHAAATTIQRVVRGRRGRGDAAREALGQKRAAIVAKLCDPKLAIANRFESQGAAFRIQTAARAWLCRRAGRRYRAALRQAAARKMLHHALASYVVHYKYKMRKMALIASLPARQAAARLLQRVITKWILRRKWQLDRLVRRKQARLRRVEAYAKRRAQPLAVVSRGLQKAQNRARGALTSLMSASSAAAKASDRRRHAAVAIQRGWRCSRLRYKKYLQTLYAQIEFLELRKTALFAHATRIQKLWRGRRARKQVKFLWLDKVTRHAVAKWRARRHRRRTIAAQRIQRKFRGVRGRRLAKLALAEMAHARRCATTLQRLVRPWLATRHMHRLRDTVRRRHETHLVCVASLQCCRQAAVEYLIFKSLEGAIGDVLTYPAWLASASGFTPQHISFPLLQLLFLDYNGLKREHLSSMPLKELQQLRLDRSKFLKVFRDAFPNTSRHMDMSSDADKVLSRLKEYPSQSRISLSYAMFTAALKDMAMLAIKSKATDLSPDARLLTLVIKHINSGKWATKSKAADQLAAYVNQWLDHAARCLQRLARRARDRDRGNALLHIKRVEWQQRLLAAAAATIQRAWRRRAAQSYLRSLVRAVFRKYIDAATGLPYWTNPRTGYSTWTKPRLLGKGDVDTDVIPMADADTEYSIRCTNCNINPIAESCFHCEDMYCASCYAQLHAKGKMATHVHFAIQGCSLCKFQVGTRHCHQCNADYCDNCMRYVHQKGNLAFHTADPLVALCLDCKEVRAVRVQCRTHDVKLCLSCAHGHPPELCRLETIPFLPFSLDDALNRVHLDRREKLEAEQKRMQDQRDLEARRLQSALRIQRNWRRKLAHQKGFQKLLSLATAKQAEWAKRQRDRKKQRTLGFVVKDIFGKAGFLETDTPAHQVLRRLNVFTRHKILARIRKLQVPLDEYLFLGVLLPGHASIAAGSTFLETSEDVRGWVVNGQALRIQDHVCYIHASEAMLEASLALHEPFRYESAVQSPYYAIEFSTQFPTHLKAILGAKVQSLAHRVDEDSFVGKSLNKMAKSVQGAALRKKVALEIRNEEQAEQLDQDKKSERQRSVISAGRRQSCASMTAVAAAVRMASFAELEGLGPLNGESDDGVGARVEPLPGAPIDKGQASYEPSYDTPGGAGTNEDAASSYPADAYAYQAAASPGIYDATYGEAAYYQQTIGNYGAYSSETDPAYYDFTQTTYDAAAVYGTSDSGGDYAAAPDQAAPTAYDAVYGGYDASYPSGEYPASGEATVGSYDANYSYAAHSTGTALDAPSMDGSGLYDAYNLTPLGDPSYGTHQATPSHTAPSYDDYASASYDPSTSCDTSTGYNASAGYDFTNGYDQQASYDQHAAYDQQNGYDQQAGYDQHAGYNQQTGYDQQGGYDQQAGYDQQTGYDQQGGYHQQGGYDQQVGYDPQAGYDMQVGYDTACDGAYDVSGSADGTDPWQEIYDPQSGQSYYYNAITGESVWKT
ncbi:hypothetical protein SPRG_02946 [Saprolegnia parasitica CBS 223.65]|uniref:Probable pectate lyase F n=1 Tax=Saprolegnia parasitica (strain CBS 223.65) TaxID=695850 RepID=A0A067CP35_SAPPC|nr:hypothetical protein SPRG_02946 [Saprolegnia parasitica CBS 223.65]KDO32469.1 hypothetical protein SPRG_02946 [Saprolegnia parasitica CBS 223.65]|eukprot:XP_012196920.1 hypothetical protein SPRG_02946 [Saprolegnia parasitica CBS 223.65]